MERDRQAGLTRAGAQTDASSNSCSCNPMTVQDKSGRTAMRRKMRVRQITWNHLRAISLGFGLTLAANAPIAAAQTADAPAAGFEEPLSVESMRALFAKTAANGNHFCAITITQTGQLTASPDNMELSSRLVGGTAGKADVTATNGSYSISIDPTTGFNLAPPDGSSNTAFSSTFSATGATNFAETPGQFPQKIKMGNSVIEAHFIATRSPDAFPAGNYSGELILRCE